MDACNYVPTVISLCENIYGSVGLSWLHEPGDMLRLFFVNWSVINDDAVVGIFRSLVYLRLSKPFNM